MKKIFSTGVSALFGAVLMAVVLFAQPVFAHEEDPTIVRVGYYYCEKFQEGTNDDQPKSGYSYEYMQKVANYTGWQYEYVYGDWGELLTMLEHGEIDMMAGVSETPERREKLLFPRSKMGTDRYVIYQHSDNKVMDVSDLSTFDGLTIGAITDNRMSLYLENWIAENQVDLKVKYYSSFPERDDDFMHNRIDAVVATDNNVLSGTGYEAVLRVGEEPYYLAVSGERIDLLRQLNSALSVIESLEPFFTENLQYKNYGATLTDSNLSDVENDWVANHSVLRIGYLDNYMPYCGTTKDGQPDGLMTDVFSAILEQLHLGDRLSLSYKGYADYQNMISALKNGELDAVFPLGGTEWYFEKDGVDASSSVVSCSMDLVYEGTYDDTKLDSMAVTRTNALLRYYVFQNMPDTEIVYYDNVTQCLDAVKNKEVGSTIINGLRVNLVYNDADYSSLGLFQLQQSSDRYIGVKAGNHALLLLINRGLRVIGRDYGINASYQYMDELYTQSSTEVVRAFFKEHFALFLWIFVILAVCMTLFVSSYIGKTKRQRELQIQAFTDGLTMLPNRAAYERDLQWMREDGMPDDLVYASVDINGLKKENDTKGHAAGDELITGSANCLTECFGQLGTVYRTGGDEFMIIFRLKADSCDGVQEHLNELTNNWKGEMVETVNMSIGYAMLKKHPEMNIDELAKLADDRMYQAKSEYYRKTGFDRRNR